jgi:hypothetical protein
MPSICGSAHLHVVTPFVKGLIEGWNPSGAARLKHPRASANWTQGSSAHGVSRNADAN